MALKKILLVDDDPDDLDILHEILQEVTLGYDIVMLHNGKQALNALDTWKADNSLPCLLVLDINMPVMDGKEALSIIKKNEDFKDIPIVVFTTSNNAMDRLFCQQYGVEMITKPLSYTELQMVVKKLLGSCEVK